jgi:hypothetical protein
MPEIPFLCSSITSLILVSSKYAITTLSVTAQEATILSALIMSIKISIGIKSQTSLTSDLAVHPSHVITNTPGVHQLPSFAGAFYG